MDGPVIRKPAVDADTTSDNLRNGSISLAPALIHKQCVVNVFADASVETPKMCYRPGPGAITHKRVIASTGPR